MLSKEGFAINAALAVTSDPAGQGWRVLHTVIVLTSTAAMTGRGEENGEEKKRKG